MICRSSKGTIVSATLDKDFHISLQQYGSNTQYGVISHPNQQSLQLKKFSKLVDFGYFADNETQMFHFWLLCKELEDHTYSLKRLNSSLNLVDKELEFMVSHARDTKEYETVQLVDGPVVLLQSCNSIALLIDIFSSRKCQNVSISFSEIHEKSILLLDVQYEAYFSGLCFVFALTGTVECSSGVVEDGFYIGKLTKESLLRHAKLYLPFLFDSGWLQRIAIPSRFKNNTSFLLPGDATGEVFFLVTKKHQLMRWRRGKLVSCVALPCVPSSISVASIDDTRHAVLVLSSLMNHACLVIEHSIVCEWRNIRHVAFDDVKANVLILDENHMATCTSLKFFMSESTHETQGDSVRKDMIAALANQRRKSMSIVTATDRLITEKLALISAATETLENLVSYYRAHWNFHAAQHMPSYHLVPHSKEPMLNLQYVFGKYSNFSSLSASPITLCFDNTEFSLIAQSHCITLGCHFNYKSRINYSVMSLTASAVLFFKNGEHLSLDRFPCHVQTIPIEDLCVEDIKITWELGNQLSLATVEKIHFFPLFLYVLQVDALSEVQMSRLPPVVFPIVSTDAVNSPLAL